MALDMASTSCSTAQVNRDLKVSRSGRKSKWKRLQSSLAPSGVVALLAGVGLTAGVSQALISAKPAQACGWGSLYYLDPHGPYLNTSPQVVGGYGGVQFSPDSYCGANYATLTLQRKVCGFWGCNFETDNSGGANSVSSGALNSSTSWYTTAYIYCPAGTNRYRNKVSLQYTYWDGQNFTGSSASSFSQSQPEITCK